MALGSNRYHFWYPTWARSSQKRPSPSFSLVAGVVTVGLSGTGVSFSWVTVVSLSGNSRAIVVMSAYNSASHSEGLSLLVIDRGP